MDSLFTPVRLGGLNLRNRVVMAPMTRSRAEAGDMPTPLMVEYYRQRAGAGMIVTEGIAPSADGIGYCRTPGIYNAKQTDAWRKVVDAVHAEGGLIVAQIMHCGRIAHPLNKAPGSETVAPSALRARGEIYTDADGMQPFTMPRELAIEEIPGVVLEYAEATARCFDAGFDGVELHCTSGYLPAQFLSTGTNLRTDAYGGSLAGRVRFPLDVLRAMANVDGGGRVGFRISPDNRFNDLKDDDPQNTFSALLAGASELKLAYVHAIRIPGGRVDNIELARQYFPGQVIGNESYSGEEAAEALDRDELAAVSFGRPFIANPDLVDRFWRGKPLADFDPGRLYTPGPDGYTDYPALPSVS
ncbi:MAG: alkene reductase [Halieaceae bacterium]|jgi:N-ethylmaleimide reductase|nr:alkene reductase [Halieaceae bacterium]